MQNPPDKVVEVRHLSILGPTQYEVLVDLLQEIQARQVRTETRVVRMMQRLGLDPSGAPVDNDAGGEALPAVV